MIRASWFEGHQAINICRNQSENTHIWLSCQYQAASGVLEAAGYYFSTVATDFVSWDGNIIRVSIASKRLALRASYSLNIRCMTMWGSKYVSNLNESLVFQGTLEGLGGTGMELEKLLINARVL